MDSFFALVAAGLAVGLIVGVTGVGGGSLMTPTLITLFGVPPVTAVATDLGFAAITKGAGVAAHRRTGLVNWRVALLMIGGSCAAAALTMLLLDGFRKPSPAVTSAVRVSLAVALILTVFALLFQERLMRWRALRPALSVRSRTVLTLLASIVIGALVIVSSIGAGAIGVTVLTLLYPDWDSRRVAATDLAYAVPLTALGGVMHGIAGNIDGGLLLALLTGSVPGIVAGVMIGSRLHARFTRTLLASCLTVAAARLVL